MPPGCLSEERELRLMPLGYKLLCLLAQNVGRALT